MLAANHSINLPQNKFRQILRFADEMQVNSCTVYADNDLFGTFQEASGTFEYMKFSEYAVNVDRCRAVLKDLGKIGCTNPTVRSVSWSISGLMCIMRSFFFLPRS